MRLRKKRYAELSEEQKAVFDSIKVGRSNVEDGHLGGPFDAWILNPEMGRRIVGLGGTFRFRTATDRRYIELAILVVGAHWQAQFEWFAHEPMALEAGLPAEVIRVIRYGGDDNFADAGDRVVYRLCRELLTTHQVSDATYEAALDLFGEQGISELVNVSGYYTMVSMTLNTFRVPLPEGAAYPFPEN
ncbi:MAG: carboxymuconolactone decarboxylase family protein [Pseudomonadota bacterium]